MAPRPVSAQGGPPTVANRDDGAHPGLEAAVQPVASDGYQLLDRMSYKPFCGLASATNIPDRTTVWTFKKRIGEAGAKALFDGVSAQRLKKGFIARGGQIIDATLVPAPRQHTSRGIYADRGYPSAEREAWLKETASATRSSTRATATSCCPSVSSGATSASPGRAPGSSMCSELSTRWAASCFAPSARRGRSLR